jgi:DNA-directed RNA polymerase specialized sigma24 family protein
MDIKILRTTYRQQLFKLDKFFHKLLWKNPYTRHFLENHKAILLANLFEEMVKIYTREKYANYPLEKLIFKKATKVYIDYIRSLQRESIRNKRVSTDTPPEDYASGNFQDAMEARDTVALIRKFLSPDDYNLLYYRGGQGYTYKQILEIINLPSEDAAKTRFYRIKNLVKQHLGIQIIYKN